MEALPFSTMTIEAGLPPEERVIHLIVQNGNSRLDGVVDTEMDKNVAGIRAKRVCNLCGRERSEGGREVTPVLRELIFRLRSMQKGLRCPDRGRPGVRASDL